MSQIATICTTILLIFSIPNTSKISIKELKSELVKNKIKCVDIVLAQAIEESGWAVSYESINCNKRCNLFGFTLNNSYLVYDNWKESVTYYKVWQDEHYWGGDYYEFLENIPFVSDSGSDTSYHKYASNPNYIDNLKNIKVK